MAKNTSSRKSGAGAGSQIVALKAPDAAVEAETEPKPLVKGSPEWRRREAQAQQEKLARQGMVHAFGCSIWEARDRRLDGELHHYASA